VTLPPQAVQAPATPATAPLYLVDASLYVFRAWHSMPDEFRDADGWPTNAVHGFARFVAELVERVNPRYIAIAFDEALDSSFRNRIYPAYKANRPPAPEELRRQFAHCKALCRALGFVVLADTEYEADDLIGSALEAGRKRAHHGVIVSADKDLSQLLEGHDEQWDYARGVRWRADGVRDRHGVEAHQIADYLALCGDAVDNIPGVPGIGCKTAASLLHHFRTLDALLERSEEIQFLRFRGAGQVGPKLRQHADAARMYRQLTTIARDAPLGEGAQGFARRTGDADALHALCETLRFGPLTRRRLHAVAGLDYTPPASA